MEQVVSFLFKYNAGVFAKSRFGFGARPSVGIVVVVLLAIASLAYYLYSRRSSQISSPARLALIAIRSAIIVIIGFCLMRPVIVVPFVEPQSSIAAVLMDDSASMLIADESGQPRIEAIKQLMQPGSPFQSELVEQFKVRTYRFAESVEHAPKVSDLSGAGQQTNVGASIEQVVRELSGMPLSGVVVISDGAQTATVDTSAMINNLRAHNIPIFCIGLGAAAVEGDIELIRAVAPRRILTGSRAMAELLVKAAGIAEGSVKVDLTEDGHPLESQIVPLHGGDATEVVRIGFVPSSPGMHRYTVSVGPLENEPIRENNSQEFLVEVEDSRPRILYIEGEPRWEFGKIRSALAEEKNLVLVSLLRSADGKFYRQGVHTPEELSSGFPKSEEELFKFDALIVGSVETTFFTFDQLRSVEQFASRRGGALLALGGGKSFTAGGYANTPMADLLPVYLNANEPEHTGTQTFKAAVAERGRDHRVARLLDRQEDNEKAWDQMPAITIPEVLPHTKPGATVILEARGVEETKRTVPLLVEERYGRGRTLALLASDTWRWRMMLESKNKSFETFWRNFLRYMVESVRQQVEVQAEQMVYATGESVRIRAEVSDKKYMSITDAQVTVRVNSPSGLAFSLQMPRTIDDGFEGYAAPFVPTEEGLYRIEMTARRGSEVIGSDESSFVVSRLNREAYGASQNRELLQRLAAETGGKYYALADAKDLIEDLTHTENANSVHISRDLWDMPVNFLLIIGLASAEWFIRKRKGLA